MKNARTKRVFHEILVAMDPDKKKSLSAMRTFARDLDKQRGLTSKTAEPSEETPTEIPTPKPATEKTVLAKLSSETVPHTSTHSTPAEHIPAFHELQKKKESTTIKTEPKKKNKKGITTDHLVGGGEIITDTKVNTVSFITRLDESLRKWATSLKKKFTQKKKKPTYSVTDTVRRKGVVQKATSKTGVLANGDTESLKERILKRYESSNAANPGEDEISWSPYTETGYTLLDAPETAPVKSSIQNISVVPKKITTISVAPVAEPQPVLPVSETLPTVPEPEIIQTPPPVTPIEEVVPVATEPVVLSQLPVPEEAYAVPITTIETEPRSTAPWWSKERIHELDTNAVTVYVTGAILALVLICFTGYIFISSLATNEPLLIEEVVISSIISETTPVQTAVVSTNSSSAFVQSINKSFVQKPVTSSSEVLFVNERGTPIPTGAIINILTNNVGDSFKQSITGVRLFRTVASERALVFQVNDTLNAFGGLLDWESTMLSDIEGVLDIQLPSTSTSTEFSDQNIRGIDVRVLLDETTVYLLYGFIDESLVVISDSAAAFIAAYEELNKE